MYVKRSKLLINDKSLRLLLERFLKPCHLHIQEKAQDISFLLLYDKKCLKRVGYANECKLILSHSKAQALYTNPKSKFKETEIKLLYLLSSVTIFF